MLSIGKEQTSIDSNGFQQKWAVIGCTGRTEALTVSQKQNGQNWCDQATDDFCSKKIIDVAKKVCSLDYEQAYKRLLHKNNEESKKKAANKALYDELKEISRTTSLKHWCAVKIYVRHHFLLGYPATSN